MNQFLINFIAYLLLWIVFFSRIRRFNLFMIAWTGFTVSSFLSYLSVINNLYYYSLDFAFDTSSLETLALVLATNLIISLPLWKVDERKIRLLSINTELPFLRYFVIVNIVFFTIVSVLKIYEVSVIGTITSYSEVYQMMNDDESTMMLRDLLYTNYFLRTLSGIGGSYCPTIAPFILLYFLNKIAKHKKLSSKYLFGITVTLIPVLLQGIANASRGMIFFSMFQVLFYYIIIRHYLRTETRKIIMAGGVLIIVLFFGVTYAITESRVADRRSSYTADDDISIYFGQPMLNACYFQDKIKYHPWGKRLLDIREGSGSVQKFRDYWNPRTGSAVHLFKTYYGDLYLEFGLIGAFFFMLMYTGSWDIMVIRKYQNPIYVPFLWHYFHTVIFGIFDFYNPTKLMGIWFILLIILCYYLNMKQKKYVPSTRL